MTLLELRQISVEFEDQARPVLTEVELSIDEGELTVVLGPTGSGKSTLLGVVSGLVPSFTGGRLSGDLLWQGESILTLPARERAGLIGFVGQDPAWGFVTDTVEEELAYGMEQLGLAPATMRRRVEETLDLLGIADLRDRPLRTLSGGQQQRVAIGSVIATSPRVLVLDEPTSALDPIAAEEVLATVSRLVRDLGTTVVMAEHRMERVIEFADSVLLINEKVRHGPTRSMLAAASIRPPLVELGTRLRWTPMPLTIREGRRFSSEQRRSWMEHPPAVPARPEPGRSILTGRGIVVRYGEKIAVAGVDLSLHRGQVTALMGRNGCGKSSLLWALHGAGRRDGGTVTTSDGASVSLVPQTPTDLLYLGTVRAECSAGDRAADLADGTTLDLLGRLVPGIDPEAHPRDLSEGQKLAVVLAVELAADPPVVLLDEPTRGLDYAAKSVLAATVTAMAAEGRAVLIATHDVEMVAATCTRVVVMAEGEVVTDGDTRDVLAGSALLATQVAKVANPIPILTVQEYLDAR